MRIVGGRWRGRQIKVPKGTVRPTADRVREAWMSIVHRSLPGSRVVDLFAGSGALGLEALSRGAASVDFVENDGAVLRTLRENADALGAGAAFTVHRQDAVTFLDGVDAEAFDVAFADPPYRLGFGERVARRWLAVPFATLLGIEHAATETMPPGGDVRRYGDTAITFYRV